MNIKLAAIVLFVIYLVLSLIIINFILMLTVISHSHLVLPMMIYCDEGTLEHANKCLTAQEYSRARIEDFLTIFILIAGSPISAFFATRLTMKWIGKPKKNQSRKIQQF